MRADQTPDPGSGDRPGTDQPGTTPAGDSQPGTSQPGTPQPGAHNALAGEPSAYLRQHAGNPVHWQPFGDQAFAYAAARNVPVFLSIGYAACHWCHVIDRSPRLQATEPVSPVT